MVKDHNFYCLVLLLATTVLAGCVSAQRMAGVRPELEGVVGRIGYYSDSPPEGTYIVLGHIKRQFNPLSSSKEIEWTMKNEAYSRWGSKVDAIIRVYSTMIPGYDFPLREIGGTVIQYKKGTSEG